MAQVLRLLGITLLTASIAAFVVSPATAETGKAAIQELVTLLSAWDGDEEDKAVSIAAARHIDYQNMAARVLGSTWSSLSPAQKHEFVESFKKIVEQRYYPRWHKLFRKGSLNYVSEASAGDDVIVKAILTVGKKQDHLLWRLHGEGNDLKVINLTVGTRDLLSRLSERFQRHLRKDGFEGMMVWLKDKLEEEEAEAQDEAREHAGQKAVSEKQR